MMKVQEYKMDILKQNGNSTQLFIKNLRDLAAKKIRNS